MVRRLLWLSVLLALPGVASADQAGVAEPVRPDSAEAGGSADASAEARVLDLSFEPAASAVPHRQAAAPPVEPASGERTPQAPFSVGLDVKTRHEVGDEARQGASDLPTLADELVGTAKRSTFGLTGTYRF